MSPAPEQAAIRIGCSGWSYESWRRSFYPEGVGQGRWLRHYAENFDTVELNATFYRLASEGGARRWVEQTPEGFLFAAKASRYMTHIRRLKALEEPIRRYYEPLEPLREAGRLGPIVWQLPPNFQADLGTRSRDQAVSTGSPRARVPPSVLVHGRHL